MWLLLAFLSATLLGFYDVFKKKALKDNAVLPVLFFNTLFSSLIFLPFILLSAFAPGVLGGTMLDVPVVGWEVHKLKQYLCTQKPSERNERAKIFYLFSL